MHSFPLAVSLKLCVPFFNIASVFAAYDCKTVHIAFLRRNFINFLSPAAGDLLLLHVPAGIS